MQSVSSRFWTRVAVSVSYDDNHYITSASLSLSLSLYIYIYIYVYIYHRASFLIIYIYIYIYVYISFYIYSIDYRELALTGLDSSLDALTFLLYKILSSAHVRITSIGIISHAFQIVPLLAIRCILHGVAKSLSLSLSLTHTHLRIARSKVSNNNSHSMKNPQFIRKASSTAWQDFSLLCFLLVFHVIPISIQLSFLRP